MKFHENPSSGSGVVSCGETNMTKLIVAVGNFANASKNTFLKPCNIISIKHVTSQNPSVLLLVPLAFQTYPLSTSH